MVPHGGVLVWGQQAVAGLHAGDRGGLAGHEDGLLVRLLRNRSKAASFNKASNTLNPRLFGFELLI